MADFDVVKWVSYLCTLAGLAAVTTGADGDTVDNGNGRRGVPPPGPFKPLADRH